MAEEDHTHTSGLGSRAARFLSFLRSRVMAFAGFSCACWLEATLSTARLLTCGFVVALLCVHTVIHVGANLAAATNTEIYASVTQDADIVLATSNAPELGECGSRKQRVREALLTRETAGRA